MKDDLAELKSQNERMKLLLQVGQVIHSTLDPQEALQLILREAVRVMRASSGSVIRSTRRSIIARTISALEP